MKLCLEENWLPCTIRTTGVIVSEARFNEALIILRGKRKLFIRVESSGWRYRYTHLNKHSTRINLFSSTGYLSCCEGKQTADLSFEPVISQRNCFDMKGDPGGLERLFTRWMYKADKNSSNKLHGPFLEVRVFNPDEFTSISFLRVSWLLLSWCWKRDAYSACRWSRILESRSLETDLEWPTLICFVSKFAFDKLKLGSLVRSISRTWSASEIRQQQCTGAGVRFLSYRRVLYWNEQRVHKPGHQTSFCPGESSRPAKIKSKWKRAEEKNLPKLSLSWRIGLCALRAKENLLIDEHSTLGDVCKSCTIF